jgi:hypothetical protein
MAPGDGEDTDLGILDMSETVEEYALRLLREALSKVSVERLDEQRRYLESMGDIMSPAGVTYADLLADVEAEITARYIKTDPANPHPAGEPR